MPCVISREKKDPRPHRTALLKAVKCVQLYTDGRFTYGAYLEQKSGETNLQFRARKREACAADAIAEADFMTWPGAIWTLRVDAMASRRRERARYVARYRPIQTLDGLDPYPPRAAMRELIKKVRVLGRVLHA